MINEMFAQQTDNEVERRVQESLRPEGAQLFKDSLHNSVVFTLDLYLDLHYARTRGIE
jgi:hypothetical protein